MVLQGRTRRRLLWAALTALAVTLSYEVFFTVTTEVSLAEVSVPVHSARHRLSPSSTPRSRSPTNPARATDLDAQHSPRSSESQPSTAGPVPQPSNSPVHTADDAIVVKTSAALPTTHSLPSIAVPTKQKNVVKASSPVSASKVAKPQEHKVSEKAQPKNVQSSKQPSPVARKPIPARSSSKRVYPSKDLGSLERMVDSVADGLGSFRLRGRHPSSKDALLAIKGSSFPLTQLLSKRPEKWKDHFELQTFFSMPWLEYHEPVVHFSWTELISTGRGCANSILIIFKRAPREEAVDKSLVDWCVRSQATCMAVGMDTSKWTGNGTIDEVRPYEGNVFIPATYILLETAPRTASEEIRNLIFVYDDSVQLSHLDDICSVKNADLIIGNANVSEPTVFKAITVWKPIHWESTDSFPLVRMDARNTRSSYFLKTWIQLMSWGSNIAAHPVEIFDFTWNACMGGSISAHIMPYNSTSRSSSASVLGRSPPVCPMLVPSGPRPLMNLATGACSLVGRQLVPVPHSFVGRGGPGYHWVNPVASGTCRRASSPWHAWPSTQLYDATVAPMKRSDVLPSSLSALSSLLVGGPVSLQSLLQPESVMKSSPWFSNFPDPRVIVTDVNYVQGTVCSDMLVVSFVTTPALERYAEREKHLLNTCKEMGLSCLVLHVHRDGWTGSPPVSETHVDSQRTFMDLLPIVGHRTLVTVKPLLMLMVGDNLPENMNVLYVDVDIGFVKFPDLFCNASLRRDADVMVFNHLRSLRPYQTSVLIDPEHAQNDVNSTLLMRSASAVMYWRGWNGVESRSYIREYIVSWIRSQNYMSNPAAADDAVFDILWNTCGRWKLRTMMLSAGYFCSNCAYSARYRKDKTQYLEHDAGSADVVHEDLCPAIPAPVDFLRMNGGWKDKCAPDRVPVDPEYELYKQSTTMCHLK